MPTALGGQGSAAQDQRSAQKSAPKTTRVPVMSILLTSQQIDDEIADLADEIRDLRSEIVSRGQRIDQAEATIARLKLTDSCSPLVPKRSKCCSPLTNI